MFKIYHAISFQRSNSMLVRQVGAITCLSLLLLLGSSPLRAQVSSASVNGTVRDTTGAVVPGAELTLRETSTRVTRTTFTNTAGDYVIIGINPGTYTLEIKKAGFQTTQGSPFPLNVNQTATFAFTLAVGSVTQEVTVSTASAQLQTSTANLGTVIGNHEVSVLPLNGRNFTQLLLLAPGMSRVNTSQSGSGNFTINIGSTQFPAVNGQPNRSSLYLLDGINDQSYFYSVYAVQPIVDAIQEFKVQSHNDQTQFGGVMGGVVNVVTKSGTNQFHGDVWEFLRNDYFDARNPLLPAVTPLKQNVYGATIGGPVMFPHYYNGRNHTFFFGAWEGTTINSAAESLYNVPTTAELSGDFSAISTKLYNPYTTAPDPSHSGQYTRNPFPNNNISSALDPTMVTLAKQLYPPALSTPISGYNGTSTQPSEVRSNNYSLRVDRQVAQSNQLWARLSQFHTTRNGTGGLSTLFTNEVLNGQNWAVTDIQTFGTSSTLEVEAGHVRQRYWSVTRSANPLSTTGWNQGFVCGFLGPLSCQVPVLAIAGYGGGGPSYQAVTDGDIYEGRADLIKLMARHMFQVGTDINHTGGSASNANNNENFSAIQTSNLENQAGTGDALASFLIGAPNLGERRNNLKQVQGGWVNAIYFSDQWKVTPTLTINLGFRYDWEIMPQLSANSTQANITGALDLRNGTYVLTKDAGNIGSCATLGAAPCIPGGVLPANVVVGKNNSLIMNQVDNVQPRFGLAYQLNKGLVVHLGYARVYDVWSAALQYVQNEGALWPSFGLDLLSNLNATTVTASAENPLNLPAGASSTLPLASPFLQSANYIDPHIRNPLSDQWTVGVQQQLGSNTFFSLNYVGSLSHRLECCGMANVAPTPGPGKPQSRAPFPYIKPTNYAQSIGQSNYNGLQAQIERKVNSGLAYTFNYTWSKTIDVGCDGYLNSEGCFVRNEYNPKADRSVAGYDLTHIFTGNVEYELPFGSGQRFRTNNRLADAIIGNWQISAIANLTSGSPYTVSYSGDVANTGNGYQGVDLVGNPKLSHPTIAEWFNTAAFQAPATYTYGNAGRNILRTDWYRDADLSVCRRFPFEHVRIEFRAEAFNFTNTTVWGSPAATLNSVTFGQVSSTASTQRELQFALKAYF